MEHEAAEMRGQVRHNPVSLSIDHVSPVTRLLEKRKQMLQVQEALDAQKQEYMRKEDLFKRREENLRKKDLELQEALVLFNKYLKENEHKRRRADHRAADEVKKRLRWEKDIETRQVTFDKLNKRLRKLKEKVRRMEKYQGFLQQVFDEHESHFDEIQSIILRHENLAEAKRDLETNQEKSIKDSETQRQAYIHMKKENYNKTLSLNNDIAGLSKELEEAVKRAGDIEVSLHEGEKVNTRQERDIIEIIMAVENIFARCKQKSSNAIKHGLVVESPGKEKEGLVTLDPQGLKVEEALFRLEVMKDYLKDYTWMVEAISGKTNQYTGAYSHITTNTAHAAAANEQALASPSRPQAAE